MHRILCKSKIHRAKITQAELYYEGSISIDSDLLRQADILPYEKVQVVNINNGNRFETYAICGEPGSGVICLNGAAARLGHVGDEIIIITYAEYSEDEARCHRPTIILVDKANAIKETIIAPAGPDCHEYLNS
jgi:aspartate 1-decarboxylase